MRRSEGRAYLRVASWAQEFDPDDLTRLTGVEPTRTWKKGEIQQGNGRNRTFDCWEVESPAGTMATLTTQTTALGDLIRSSPRLAGPLAPLEPVLQYAIETPASERREVRIEAGLIEDLVTLNARVDFDLYWICRENIEHSLCSNCGVRAPSSLQELRQFIGGELRAAELQIKLAFFDCDRADAEKFLAPADEDARRLGHDFELVYLEGLSCLQFTTDIVPASGYIEDLGPEIWTKAFLKDVAAVAEPLTAGGKRNAELLMRLIERGDYQGTTGLHFDGELLRQIKELNSDLVINLRYLPDPLIQPTGKCFHCDVDILMYGKAIS